MVKSQNKATTATAKGGPAKQETAKAAEPDMVAGGLVPISQRDITLILESGYLFIELKKHHEAEEIFLGVSAILPLSEVPHLALGNLYFSQGRFAQALKSHEHALSLAPSSATAHASAAESLFFLRRHEDAITHLDRALALELDGPAHEFAAALKEAYDLGIFA